MKKTMVIVPKSVTLIFMVIHDALLNLREKLEIGAPGRMTEHDWYLKCGWALLCCLEHVDNNLCEVDDASEHKEVGPAPKTGE